MWQQMGQANKNEARRLSGAEIQANLTRERGSGGEKGAR